MTTHPSARASRHFAWMLIAFASPALAGYQLTPYASVTAEYNSNVFDLPNAQVARAENGDDQLADTVLRYLAGAEGALPLRKQKLRALIELRRLDFLHFGRLDHNEYLFGTGLDWRLLSTLDGALDYRQERRMASFADRTTTALALETERITSGSANLVINPEWRLESGLRLRSLDSPLPAFPDFALKENSISLAAKYLAIDKLVAGVFTEYMSGKFEGVPAAGKFHQESIELVADYTLSEISKVAAKLGYTRRNDDAGGTVSGLTGMAAYHRDLTGKTSADVQIFRRVRSYVGGASSVVESGIGTALAWRATEKIAVAGAAEWVHSTYEDAAPSSGMSQRKDDYETLSVKVNYLPRPWLALRPYTGYRVRNSNLDRDDFHTAIVGLEVEARFQLPRP